ncbi:Rv3235 family protein [Phytoactinopolyspora endophytica]|uniref:Rv3235 family protein n=1 Tax=Phytoactinopolyspora endophytica TaxID=1642495 RepID=UPI003B835290
MSPTSHQSAPLHLAEDATRGSTQQSELPDPRRWCARLAQAAVESIQGRRPLQQLLRWTTEEVYDWLAGQAAARRDVPPGPRPSIRSVRVCEVNTHVFEAAAVLQMGERTRALALRCEARRGRWVCTVFDLI